jgi:inosine/xanthosine triphosphatase
VTILVGSTRPAKVEGVREAVAAIARIDSRFLSVDIQPHDLTSIAPRMPMTTAEIVQGARRRADALLKPKGHVRPDFAIGLEGGIDRLEPAAGVWTLQTWAVVSDGTRFGYGAGPALMLPVAVTDRVTRGEELGDVIDELAADEVRGTRGAWGVLTRDLIGRRDAFRLAVIAAFAPFYNGAAWDSRLRPS